MSVKRYQPVAQCVEPSYQAQMIEPKVMEFSEGEYVLHSDYAALLAATQWRPIETATWDNLRKHMVIVLITKKRDFEIGFVEDWAGQLVITNKDGLPVLYEVDDVTHWMPLPKPPSA